MKKMQFKLDSLQRDKHHRLEELLACSMLMQASFCSPDEFISLVDALFLEDSESLFLQELEWSFHDIPRCIHLIDEYFKKTSADDNVLSEILLSRLRVIYLSESLDMTEFTRRAYRLWSLLPETLANDDAFSVLSCADEVLGGWCQKDPEKETRALLEKALGIRGEDMGEDASDQEQITPAKSGARRRRMKKQRTDTKPLTRMTLYLLSVSELYTALAAIGGIAFVLMLIISFVKIDQGEMSPSGLGCVILGALAITGILLLIGYFVALGRTKPPYRYYRKRGIRFPACLSDKCLTCADQEQYLYFDDTWFVAVLTMGASALCADVIDFSVPVTEKVLSGRGGVAHIYQFRTKDGARITARLGWRIKPFKKWVQAHGGSFA